MRLHLVDGTYELFRAYFSKRPDHMTPRGESWKAVVGVVSSLFYLLRDPSEQTTHLAVAFDNPIESFRNELFAGYKTGAGMPEDLVAQMDPVEEAVRAAGIVVWRMDRWEADDALATAAARWAHDVEQVRICTPDKDLGQCLDGDRVVQVDRMRNKVVNEAELVVRRGIRPQSIPDYLALTGDEADGVPGLPGFGDKTAATLLAAFVHLEAIPDDPAAWPKLRGAEKLAATWRERRDDAFLYRRLTTLVRDVPLAESLDDLRWRGVSADWDAWCTRAGSDRLRAEGAS